MQVKLGVIYLVRTLPPPFYGNFLYPLIRNSVSDQLNALVRLKRYIYHEKMFLLGNSFINSNFDCCFLEWMFLSKRSLNEIKDLQERALCFVLDD